MPKLSQFSFDPRAETEGVRVHLGEGLYVVVGRVNSPRFVEAMRKHSGPYKFEMDRNTLSEDVAQKILVKVYAETILLGWENMQDEAGQDIPYSREAARKAMEDYPEFFNMVKDAASRMELFRSAERAEAAKNS